MWRGFFGEGIIKEVNEKHIDPLRNEIAALRQEIESMKDQLSQIQSELVQKKYDMSIKNS